MLTQEEYLWAWACYALGALIFMGVFWFFTAKITRSEPKYLLRIVAAVVLFVPWYTDGHDGYLSPAWLISIIEGIFEGPDAFWRAGTPLLVALLLALIISCLFFIIRWFWRYRRAQTA